MMIGWSEIEMTASCLMRRSWIGKPALRRWAPRSPPTGLPVVMCPDGSCYINYVEGTSANLQIEPPFVVGGAPAYLAVSTVYGFNPIPTGLATQFQSNILGAQCNLWGEYVPSFRNYMFKMFPRETAMAEITWTPRAQQNFTSFSSRLVTEEQRFTQMGLNYDHETIPQVGTWGPTVATSPVTNLYDITANVTAAGEIDISFWWTSGSPLAISSVTLLVNGVPVSVDTHSGLAESSSTYQATEPFIPIFTLYVLHLPQLVPGADYKVQAVIAGSGGSTTSGTVYMPNWN